MREPPLALILLLSASALTGCANPKGGGGEDHRPGASAPASSPAPATAARKDKAAAAREKAKPPAPAPLVSNRYAVTVNRAPFYFYGPAQSQGPDLGLVKGSKVTMIQPDRLFSKVRTDYGHEGYVSTDYLEQLPPEPPPIRARAVSLSEGELPAFYHNLQRKPLPEMKVVPVEMMLLAEPPLPTGSESAPATEPPKASTETLIPTSTTTAPSPTPVAP